MLLALSLSFSRREVHVKLTWLQPTIRRQICESYSRNPSDAAGAPPSKRHVERHSTCKFSRVVLTCASTEVELHVARFSCIKIVSKQVPFRLTVVSLEIFPSRVRSGSGGGRGAVWAWRRPRGDASRYSARVVRCNTLAVQHNRRHQRQLPFPAPARTPLDACRRRGAVAGRDRGRWRHWVMVASRGGGGWRADAPQLPAAGA